MFQGGLFVCCVMAEPTSQTIIIFDTDCVLCSSLAHFILRNERDDQTLFVSAWCAEGSKHAKVHGLSTADLDQTFLVVKGDRGIVRSDAALALLPHLKMPYRAMTIFRIVPRPIRDVLYGLVARNRYRWFGRKDACFVPSANQRHRFINDL